MAHLLLALMMAGAAAEPGGLTVQATSPRMGLTFTDAEPLDVRARVANADAPVAVTFSVREAEGPWQQTGEVTLDALDDGEGEIALPLKPPGIGPQLIATRPKGQPMSNHWTRRP